MLAMTAVIVDYMFKMCPGAASIVETGR